MVTANVSVEIDLDDLADRIVHEGGIDNDDLVEFVLNLDAERADLDFTRSLFLALAEELKDEGELVETLQQLIEEASE